MAIPLIKEPEDLNEGKLSYLERCYFCNTPTNYWHENTNNPVCPQCAKTHKVAELPDHGATIRRLKRQEARNRKNKAEK